MNTIHMRKLSGRDYVSAGTFTELLFLGLVMANNILRPQNTNLVFISGFFAVGGLVLMGYGYGR